MDQELNSEGICCTCSFRADCLPYKNSKLSGRAIMHCEEFDDLAANTVDKKQTEIQLNRCAGDKNETMMNCPIARGLCVNCDDAEICKFPAFGDDVVFCEEHSSNFENARNDRVSHKIFANVLNHEVKNPIPGWDA